VLDNSSQTEILSHIANLSSRLGYETTFLDHDTIYSIKKSQEKFIASFFILDISSEYDHFISFLLASTRFRDYSGGFLATKARDLNKYLDFLSTVKADQFIINKKIPNNSVLTGSLGMISSCLTIFTKNSLTKEIEEIKELSKTFKHYPFLDMSGSTFNISSVNSHGESCHILFKNSFNIIESPVIIMDRYRSLFNKVFIKYQKNLDWRVEHEPWYDFALTTANFIKRLSLNCIEISSFCDENPSPVYTLRKYAKLTSFNYSPNLNRSEVLLNRAEIYYNLIGKA
jgi:hypothetical protein